MQPRTVDEITAFVGGTLVQGDGATVIRAVCTDSRTIEARSLFIPLRGERFDGHEFIEQALDGGAQAVFVSRARRETWERLQRSRPDAAFIEVSDPLHALQSLAAAVRRNLPRVGDRVLAVTGSVGKTTTKDMLAAMVGVRWATTGTAGNYNNEIGLPLTLLEADDTTEALVLEMGMRGLGEIRALSRIAHPKLAVITNVSEVHIERLGTVERIAAAKRELIDELPADGTAVLNGDDPRVRAMASHARGKVLFYGLERNNDVRATDIVHLGSEGVSFTLTWGARKWAMRVPAPGRHNVYNALAAGTAAAAIGLEPEHMNEGLLRFAHTRSDMRLQIEHRSDGAFVIDDAYNASPASVGAALDVLNELANDRRRVAVLGDMLELGSVAREAHAAVGRRAATAADVLIAVGQYSGVIASAAADAGLSRTDVHVCGTAGEAALVAERVVRPDDAVLVKASRGVALEAVTHRLLAAEDASTTTEEVPR